MIRAEQRATQPAPRRGIRRFGCLIAILIVLVAGILVAISLVLYGESRLHSPQGSGTNAVPFAVHSGDTIGKVAKRLQHDGLLHDSLFFRIDARLQGLGSKLRVGIFLLRPDMSIDQMISVLATGEAHMITVTIPEGWRAQQIAAQLTRLGINGRQFLNTVRHPSILWAADPQLRKALDVPAHVLRQHTLNGFLFPDTYLVDPGTSGSEIAQLMVQRFTAAFTPSMRALARRQHHSIYHLTIMASIIEREDRFAYQKPAIASVYYNRLHTRMPMDSDPTVQYALGAAANWWPQLSVADYQSVHSPYNTYLHLGYPPGPIANPGLSSLRAALHPAHTNYFYFSGRGNTGVLLFAQTLQQQQENIRRYG